MVAVEGIPVAIADENVTEGQSEHMVAVPSYSNGQAFTVMDNPRDGQMQVDIYKVHANDPPYWEQPPHLGLKGTEGILRMVYHNRNPAEGPPLSESLMATAPPELKVKGVSDADWAHWIKLLTDTVNVHAGRAGEGCGDMAAFLALAVLSLGLLVPRMCKARSKATMEQDVRFREWQEAFNRLYLQPRGIFVKSQSCCWAEWVQQGDQTHKVRSYRRWLSFAVGPAATRNLEMQPHLDGDIEYYKLCGGPDESQCCCHP